MSRFTVSTKLIQILKSENPEDLHISIHDLNLPSIHQAFITHPFRVGNAKVFEPSIPDSKTLGGIQKEIRSLFFWMQGLIGDRGIPKIRWITVLYLSICLKVSLLSLLNRTLIHFSRGSHSWKVRLESLEGPSL